LFPAINRIPKELKEQHDIQHQSLIKKGMENVDTITKKRQELGNSNKELKSLLDFVQYISICSMDFVCISRRFMTSETEWDILLNARVFSLALHEFLYNNNSLWKTFNNAVSKLDSDSHKNEMKELVDRLRAMKKENEVKTRTVRNNIIAHMNADPEEQLNVIVSMVMEIEQLMKLSLTVVNLLTDVVNLFNKIIK
ncbi:MAG TPA: hypothetical protein VNY36_05635, partial [Bacteroidia bacterium]|nr:hypothetical protein [Bacteroidia bacterium]